MAKASVFTGAPNARSNKMMEGFRWITSELAEERFRFQCAALQTLDQQALQPRPRAAVVHAPDVRRAGHPALAGHQFMVQRNVARVQAVTQLHGGRQSAVFSADIGIVGVHGVQHHVVVSGIMLVAVRIPCTGPQVYFHGTGPKLPIDAHQGIAQVGAAVLLDAPGLQHFQRLPIGSAQVFGIIQPGLPQGLQQFLAVRERGVQQRIAGAAFRDLRVFQNMTGALHLDGFFVLSPPIR
jgi:hypothetical protein